MTVTAFVIYFVYVRMYVVLVYASVRYLQCVFCVQVGWYLPYMKLWTLCFS